MARLFSFGAVIYLLIYAFEAAIRWGLFSVGMDNAILARDALIMVPLAILFVAQCFRLRVHPAFWVFAVIIALHGLIATLVFRTTIPAIYGAKMLVNVLFGFIAARQLLQPGRSILALFALVWLVCVVGVGLEKFVYSFPWTGLSTHVGGITVPMSVNWDIDSGIEKRAAGFMRSSISAAMLIPVLGLILACRQSNWMIRFLVLAITVGTVFLTTQKGSVLAIAGVSVALLVPMAWRWTMLTWECIGFTMLVIMMPIFTAGLLIAESGGVFSLSSFAMRITDTWPDAWRWINDNQLFPFGVGLGGIGGAQRFFAEDFMNPSDNLYVFLYGTFGVLGLVYLGWAIAQMLLLPRELRSAGTTAAAVLTFNIGYGVALSMLEDQVSALFIGASVGLLWQMRQFALARPWSDPFVGAGMRVPVPIVFGRPTKSGAMVELT